MVIKKGKKRTCRIVDFAIPAKFRVKIKESKKERQVFGPCQRTKKKQWNLKVTVTLIVIGAFGMFPLVLERRLEELEIRRWFDASQTIALLQSARILRRVLRRLAVTLTPVKDHQQKLVWKTYQEKYCWGIPYRWTRPHVTYTDWALFCTISV